MLLVGRWNQQPIPPSWVSTAPPNSTHAATLRPAAAGVPAHCAFIALLRQPATAAAVGPFASVALMLTVHCGRRAARRRGERSLHWAAETPRAVHRGAAEHIAGSCHTLGAAAPVAEASKPQPSLHLMQRFLLNPLARSQSMQLGPTAAALQAAAPVLDSSALHCASVYLSPERVHMGEWVCLQ